MAVAPGLAAHCVGRAALASATRGVGRPTCSCCCACSCMARCCTSSCSRGVSSVHQPVAQQVGKGVSTSSVQGGHAHEPKHYRLLPLHPLQQCVELPERLRARAMRLVMHNAHAGAPHRALPPCSSPPPPAPRACSPACPRTAAGRPAARPCRAEADPPPGGRRILWRGRVWQGCKQSASGKRRVVPWDSLLQAYESGLPHLWYGQEDARHQRVISNEGVHCTLHACGRHGAGVGN